MALSIIKGGPVAIRIEEEELGNSFALHLP
jgi:hypothetical protein